MLSPVSGERGFVLDLVIGRLLPATEGGLHRKLWNECLQLSTSLSLGITDSGAPAACPSKSVLSDLGLERRSGIMVVVWKFVFWNGGRMFSICTNVADGFGYVSRRCLGIGKGFLVGGWVGRESLSGC